MGLLHSPLLNRDGLVLHMLAGTRRSYPGTGTTWYDISGNNNHGSMVGGVTYLSSNGGVMSFDGVDDRVSFSRNPIDATLQTNYTMTAWVRKTSGTAGSIISQYTNITGHRLIRIFAYSSSEFAYYASTSSGGFQRVSYSSVPTLGQLHFLSIVVSGPLSEPTCRLGLNGVEQSFSLTALSSTPDTNVPIYLACSNYNNTPQEFASFTAYDDLRIYNRALSPFEIKQIYNSTRKRFGV